mmetsp:Transcript_23238/g.53091  ORF Transcript_23238/g.53091 Transcript_23238/m.53091 type:complete len:295 (-) Transcript_23238:98-982(-)|eukprot:CAMPEP_0113314308 /NCGR_PEP_ID=MMETSP0010_2-20120614/10420_1 /TAXON_ID=216773 ORGANISM="Corethron hystrix, Strain 308" /NCGR_SAMPLE_ID=MMETSP0010_2 /ASSEMBLY_ACC=CAM_ASM_000155 /LENGTH=294 /DNA_ID=CAMNT_0000170567 /DNA_START=224 /DNA_END=1108 /DNA_ORIENTATION=- /assembly_acc=CAM_ASM_000155
MVSYIPSLSITATCVLSCSLAFNVAWAEENEGIDLVEYPAWFQAYGILGPYVIALFLVVCSLHFLIFPRYLERKLMQQYVDNNVICPGYVISCEAKLGQSSKYCVGVVYEVMEHRYADNPSMYFRFPDACDKKNILLRTEYNREVNKNEPVEVLLSERKWPRSGIPREIVESILLGEGEYVHSTIILTIGLLFTAFILGLSIKEVLSIDEEGFTHSDGFTALLLACGTIEVFSLICAADYFFKEKRRKYDSARPMILSTDREEARVIAEKKPANLDPYSFKFHEFAGHARASGY